MMRRAQEIGSQGRAGMRIGSLSRDPGGIWAGWSGRARVGGSCARLAGTGKATAHAPPAAVAAPAPAASGLRAAPDAPDVQIHLRKDTAARVRCIPQNGRQRVQTTFVFTCNRHSSQITNAGGSRHIAIAHAAAATPNQSPSRLHHHCSRSSPGAAAAPLSCAVPLPGPAPLRVPAPSSPAPPLKGTLPKMSSVAPFWAGLDPAGSGCCAVGSPKRSANTSSAGCG